MIKEAASAGFFDTPFGRFPRMQVMSVARVLEGRLPKLPPQERGGGFRQAAREDPQQQKNYSNGHYLLTMLAKFLSPVPLEIVSSWQR
jgi:hypothetical protein